jgi:hypothetical protein
LLLLPEGLGLWWLSGDMRPKGLMGCINQFFFGFDWSFCFQIDFNGIKKFSVFYGFELGGLVLLSGHYSIFLLVVVKKIFPL